MTKHIRFLTLIVACVGLTISSASAQVTPGETSGTPLAPMRVVDHDPATEDMRLAYQTGCDTIDNNIYYGSLDLVSSHTWSGEVCGIGASGSHSGFNPGAGSYFFVVVGNDGFEEGSYGPWDPGAATAEASNAKKSAVCLASCSDFFSNRCANAACPSTSSSRSSRLVARVAERDMARSSRAFSSARNEV